MTFELKDGHLYGGGAAACATCCAPPLLTLLGISGAAAVAATFVLAGAVFATVVAVGVMFAGWRRSVAARGPWQNRPVDIELTDHRGPRSGEHP